ncbi:MAG: UbiA family prenyltransferase [Acidilobaceae archaeon]
MRITLARFSRITSGYLAVFRLKLLLSTALTTLAGALYAFYSMGDLDLNLLPLLAILILGTTLAHIAMHALDDYLDVIEGLDKGLSKDLYTVFGYYYSPVVEGRISLRETLVVAIVAFIGAFAIGVYLALERGILVLLFALAGAAIILSYHSLLLAVAPGELALLAKDMLVFTGSYYVIAREIDVLTFIPAIAVSTAHIVYSLNKVPRASYDREKKRKTLPSILGQKFWIGYLSMTFLTVTTLIACTALNLMPHSILVALAPATLTLLIGLKLRAVESMNIPALKKLSDLNQLALLVYKVFIIAGLALALTASHI